MTTKQNQSNILKFKKKKQLNIGIIIFGIIFLYLIATVVRYVNAPHIAVYEVRQGSLLKDNAFTGLAIRDEVVVTAESSGYINYYTPETSKVKVGSDIYTISTEELEFEETVSAEDLSLSDEEVYKIMLQIQDFNNDFQESDFSSTYYVKNEITEELNSHSNQSRLNQLSTMLNQGNTAEISVYDTNEDGVVVYSIDGYESLTKDNAVLRNLDKTNYKKTEFTNNRKISTGEIAYKLITDDEWIIMIELSEETAEVLADKNYVKVNFSKDDKALWANFEIQQKEGSYIGYLYFTNAMVRYATERYLDIELILEDETGLKIPKSAETEKEFYIVPKTYLIQGGNNSDNSVLRKTTDAEGNTIEQLMSVTVYYEDDEVVYLDPAKFKAGDQLVKEDSQETFKLQDKRPLKGVYCINKGYAAFKQINILCESDTYYIVEEGNSYGLSNYDHIALDSTNIKENDVVF